MLGNGTDSERLSFVLKKLEQVEAAYIKLESQLADRDAEIEMLRADLVWAVRHGASEGYDGNSDPCIWYSGTERHRNVLVSRECMATIDGTHESICRAVREARDGVS